VPPEPLTYEKMLAELHGLLGELVIVTVMVEIDGRDQPLAVLGGVLRRGAAADLSVMPGEPGVAMPFPGGESMIFTVAGDEHFGTAHPPRAP